jgi:pyruvate dehydrogenase kinase 2/3/4
MPSVKKVRGWYVQSFAELYNFPNGRIRDVADEERFTRLVSSIYQRHSPTLMTMARGLYELKQERRKSFGENDLDLSDYAEVHQFLDSFYLSRIGLRTLIGQHIELHKQQATPVKDYSGLICKRTFPVLVARDAIEDARYMCMRNHMDAPQVTVHGQTELSFPYIPEHLYYIFFELLKNSMRAVVEFHREKEGPMPPIRVIIADSESNEDVSIKISDEGGGISRSNLNRIWSYLYSTAKFNLEGLTKEDYPDFGRDAPLAGLGYGLPLSRLYSRYFGGDLQVISMESYGTGRELLIYLSLCIRVYVCVSHYPPNLRPRYDSSRCLSSLAPTG